MNKKKLFEQMVLIRCFEERVEKLFSEGKLRGTVHCCIGQEAVAVGVINALEADDIVVSNHRGHGHYIAYSDDVEGLMAELMGKPEGVCQGRGGSQHLHYKNFYSNGITGGMVPVATGMAMAEKRKGTGNIVCCFFGDGALGEGVLYESFNIASLWGLPILYVCENNFYAMSTKLSKGLAGSILARAQAFGLESNYASGFATVTNIHKLISIVRKAMRIRPSPHFVEIQTYRQCGHSKSDDLCYMDEVYKQLTKECDPIKSIPSKLRSRCEERVLRASS